MTLSMYLSLENSYYFSLVSHKYGKSVLLEINNYYFFNKSAQFLITFWFWHYECSDVVHNFLMCIKARFIAIIIPSYVSLFLFLSKYAGEKSASVPTNIPFFSCFSLITNLVNYDSLLLSKILPISLYQLQTDNRFF